MKRFLCFCLFVSSLSGLVAQESVQDTTVVKEDSIQELSLYKNALLLTVGTIVYSSAITGSYERMIIENKNPPFRALTAKFGAGRLLGWAMGDFAYTMFSLSVGVMLGGESSFFEMGFGGLFLDGWHQPNYLFFGVGDKQYETFFYPAGSLGYRYQKPGGAFVFRVGAAFPESLYLSIGVCF